MTPKAALRVLAGVALGALGGVLLFAALVVFASAALATARAGLCGPGAGPAPGAAIGVGGSLLLPGNRAVAAARFFYVEKAPTMSP